MKFSRVIIVTIISTMCVFCARAEKISNTISAVRVFQFSAPAELDSKIYAGLQPSARFNEADAIASAMLKVPNGFELMQMVSVSLDSTNNEIRVTIDLHEAPPGTPMIAAETADQVQQAVMNAITPASSRELDDLEHRRMQFKESQRRQLDDLKALQEHFGEQVGLVDVSPTTVRQLLSSLQTQRDTVQLDLVAKQARADSLTGKIAEFSKKIEGKITDDPIATELEKVVEFRQKEMERKQQMAKSGAATNAEADEAMGPVAEAKAKYLERREITAAAAGGDVIATWNRELMTLSIDLDELRARSKAIDERLDRLKDSAEYIRKIENTEAEVADEKKQIEGMASKISDLEVKSRDEHITFNLTKHEDQPAPATQPSGAPAGSK